MRSTRAWRLHGVSGCGLVVYLQGLNDQLMPNPHAPSEKQETRARKQNRREIRTTTHDVPVPITAPQIPQESISLIGEQFFSDTLWFGTAQIPVQK
jgi:hypothetical protein